MLTTGSLQVNRIKIERSVVHKNVSMTRVKIICKFVMYMLSDFNKNVARLPVGTILVMDIALLK